MSIAAVLPLVAPLSPRAERRAEVGKPRMANERAAATGSIDVEAYYRRYGPMVLRRCRALLRNDEKAKDAMQDTFVQLLKNAHRLEHQAPSSLLYRIATNVCLNRLRSERRHPEDRSEDLLLRIAGADDPESKLGARALLGRVFHRELESTKTIAVLHLLDGLTLEEVAAEVGLSVSGVRKRLRSLRAHIVELTEV